MCERCRGFGYVWPLGYPDPISCPECSTEEAKERAARAEDAHDDRPGRGA